jgi:hypothetical protein
MAGACLRGLAAFEFAAVQLPWRLPVSHSLIEQWVGKAAHSTAPFYHGIALRKIKEIESLAVCIQQPDVSCGVFQHRQAAGLDSR